MVYKVSFLFCVFSLAVSVGAALLLPISTISNEILLHYPKSWYIKWLNSSLIQGNNHFNDRITRLLMSIMIMICRYLERDLFLIQHVFVWVSAVCLSFL